MSSCLSLYWGSAIHWQPVQDVPHLSPNATCNPQRISAIDNGWIEWALAEVSSLLSSLSLFHSLDGMNRFSSVRRKCLCLNTWHLKLSKAEKTLVAYNGQKRYQRQTLLHKQRLKPNLLYMGHPNNNKVQTSSSVSAVKSWWKSKHMPVQVWGIKLQRT